MMNFIYQKSYTLPSVCKSEVLRYAGCRALSDEISELLESCLSEAEGIFSGNVCYGEFSVKKEGGKLDFGYFNTVSEDLSKNLSCCERALIFGATVGLGMDRLIRKYSGISPSRALMLQAVGAERIEALCNAFCEEKSRELAHLGCKLTARFSPGYGDLSLEVQRDIFRVLECSKRIGLSLNDSLLMTPSKSVTAFAGIRRNNEYN